MGQMRISQTELMGRGVFADRAIEAGETLAHFHTIKLPPADVAAIRAELPDGGALGQFWFEDDVDGSAQIVLGWLELVNHSATPNLDRTWRGTPEGDVVTVFATRPIVRGEQLFIDYKFAATDPKPAWA
jgi:SET domain-containing protein